ncbi:MAG TPA: hypothetical protein VH500_05960 [Nitrososphaeraceae archaeon]
MKRRKKKNTISIDTNKKNNSSVRHIAKPFRCVDDIYYLKKTERINNVTSEIAEPWNEICKMFEHLRKTTEKEDILYYGRIVQMTYLKHGLHFDYKFLCERITTSSGLIPLALPLIEVRLCNKSDDMQIESGDILLMRGNLKRTGSFRPNKVHNITKDVMIKL